ncbi:MAG: GspH/FimT family pseudopilin [Gemmatimonadota bacterium]|nr:GspH/FimT family pseudopilin [Gemmatimonadota bacterium]
MRTRAFTLPEILIVLTVIGTLASFGIAGFASLREAAAVRSATRVVRQQLSLARRAAVSRRETVRLYQAGNRLIVETSAGTILGATSFAGVDPLPVDSVVLRPATFRFNPRGQAAPGSVYLFRGDRSVRIVCNFLGRLRIEPVRRLR